MIRFKTLRINGFKSFCDKTEFEITHGLNGIVGPNGCGKSNLVEALRWVMGENSAKRMRGDGMEDVIFSGTEKRTSRNIAEVSLLLDNSNRTAPAAFNDSDEIEVTRRIERDRGSLYKINGKTVRARDVQMLFADTVTGANSPALVSQGRIAQIIDAKPYDRRKILEESAGISGLYARRHEAEIRLKAAERNMVRLDDILGGQQTRLRSLKRQAKQAARYKNISSQIRQMEIGIAHSEWSTLKERVSVQESAFHEVDSAVSAHMMTVSQLTSTHATQSQDIQPLREKEIEAAATLQTQKIALQRVEEEAKRHANDLQDTKTQLQQTTQDLEHEKQTLSESSEKLEVLEGEHKALLASQEDAEKTLAAKQTLKDSLADKVASLDETYNTLIKADAEVKARRDTLEKQIAQNVSRLEQLESRKSSAESDLKALEDANTADNPIPKLEEETQALESKIELLRGKIKDLKATLETGQGTVKNAREVVAATERNFLSLDAEIKAIASVFKQKDDGESFTSVLESVTPETGFEKAVARALGDSLSASLDEKADRVWKKRTFSGKLPPLPAGVSPLSKHVKAPEALELTLQQIGYVDDFAAGEKAFPDLAVGQSLVSADGYYRRWDGYTIKAEAADSNAQQLEYKTKLIALEEELPQRQSAFEKARDALEKETRIQDERSEALKQLEQDKSEAEITLRTSYDSLNKYKEKRAEYNSENNRIKDLLKSLYEDIKALQEVIKWDKERLKALLDNADSSKDKDVQNVRTSLEETRTAHQEALREFDRIQASQNSRKARLHAIADERIALKNRSIRAQERTKTLSARVEELQSKLKELNTRPKDTDDDKQALLDKVASYETLRRDSAEKLAQAQTEIEDTAKALRDAERNLADTREKRAGIQATISGIHEQLKSATSDIRERFEMEPHELSSHVVMNLDAHQDMLSPPETLKKQKEALVRERDEIGPVNLRAETEAKELENEVGGLLHEHEDLAGAISELRGAIHTINAEARTRLSDAFESVNTHFQVLFEKLFSGGKAHLELIDSDDPLEAGLEIFAQPPGKALQSLSLLSGGEQALTSIALIFGMFLTNPSPICVLDEIDAPLDDANVDKVCNVLEHMAERGETRFIIITHHRMTMARMDRLYGVTMAERGISKLVSVDLQQSFAFAEAA